VSLHKDSALGEAVLECYASGARNVFSLGFVPVAGDNTVVLLSRDTPPNSTAVRDLGVDVAQVRRARARVCACACVGV
jgi:regulator of nonsense transcripts 1